MIGNNQFKAVFPNKLRVSLIMLQYTFINSSVPETKIAEVANRVDLDEVAHNEPPHLDLHCLLSSL